MKPAPFDYFAPNSLEEALEQLQAAGWDGKVLAGGQSLVPVMNFRLAQPGVLVDLNRIPGLDGIEVDPAGNLRLGAMVRHARLEKDPTVARVAPLLTAAVPWIAHPQIRNRGTLGGSLAHADPAAELPAVMVALRARFRLRSAHGDRWVDADDFFVGLFATALEPGEILVEVLVPAASPGDRVAFLEVARRSGDYALVGVATTLRLEAERLVDLRHVLFSIGDRPHEAHAAADCIGQQPTPELIEQFSLAVGREIEPADDIHASADYRRHLAAVLTRRALTQALRSGGAA